MTTNKADAGKTAGKKILERIKKLLRMADDVSSPNEAAIAARRAERMMAEYNLSHADMITAGLSEDSLSEQFAGKALTRLPRWADLLGCAVADYTDCYVRKERVPGTVKTSLRFYGESTDLEICVYLWTYLTRTISRLCEESGVRYIGPKNSFRMGAASEISKTLKRMKKEDSATDIQTSDGKSLVLVNTKHQLMKRKYGIVVGKYGKSGYNSFDGSAENAGREAGRGVSIRKGVNHANNVRRIA